MSAKKVYFASTNALFHKPGTPSSASKDKPMSASKLKPYSSAQNLADSKTFLPPTTPKSIMKKTNLRRSKSAISISSPRRDVISTETTPVKTSPVTHYCSPRTPRRKLNVAEPSSGKSRAIPSTPECFNKVHVETPSAAKSRLSNQLLNEESSHLTVGVRVRPLNYKEELEAGINQIVLTEGNEVRVLCESNSCHNFSYDHVFSPSDSQNMVFSTFVQPLLENAFRGYNACLFAYGQTGSGKSYSMMGINSDSSTVSDEAGIIPRFCHELFERVASLEDSQVPGVQEKCTAKIEISYFEIYNEKIHDLLNDGECSGKRGNALKVREHPVFGPYVVDLTLHEVSSFENVQSLISMGSSQRASASTAMNEESSRSHSIFSIILSQTQLEDSGIEGVQNELSRCSKISLVDLAGSERVAQSCASLDRLREGVHINKSLLTLGKVITALAEAGCGKKKIFIPYRDSVLTWLLRESLGGNSRTSMLATISPANIHLEETLATLRYACQAKNIVNTVRVNEDPKDRIIRELRTELQKYKSFGLSSASANESLKVRLLQEKLSATQDKLAALEKSRNDQTKDLELAQKLADENLLDMLAQKERAILDLERNILDLNSENKRLKSKSESLENEVEELGRELEELKLDLEESHNLQELQRIEIDELRLEVNEQKQDTADRMEEVEERRKEVEELKADVEERMTHLSEQQRDIDEQRFQLDEERKELEERKAGLEDMKREIEDQRYQIEEEKAKLEDEKMKLEDQASDLEMQKTLVEEQHRSMLNQKLDMSINGSEKEQLKQELHELYAQVEEQKKKLDEQKEKLEEQREKLGEQKQKIEEQKAELRRKSDTFERNLEKLESQKKELKQKFDSEMMKKLDEIRKDSMDSKSVLIKKLDEMRRDYEESKQKCEMFMKKYEEKVEEIEEIKLSNQIEQWKKCEAQKDEFLKMQQKYETEISQKLEEHRREIESIKQKHQAELNRKLQETTEQAKRNSETDLSRKLETERQRFELELKKLNATLEKENSRSDAYRKDVKKLQRQIQLLQVDLESKTKLARELSKFNDEGFEDNITQANDYESFSKEIIHKFEQITSAVTNFANDICDDSPDEEILNISSVKTPTSDKEWLENINLKTSRRSSISANMRSPTRVTIRTLPSKKTVRFQDVSKS
nr:PREDICTED: kinesin-like protein K39 [Bemisia tabaci]